MGKTLYVRLVWSIAGIHIFSTDENVLSELLNKVRLMAKSAAIKSEIPTATGDRFYVSLHKLDGKDRGIAFWLIKHLCDEGWEPFGEVYFLNIVESGHMDFRRKAH